jgi:AcrR family transcriptional regulator
MRKFDTVSNKSAQTRHVILQAAFKRVMSRGWLDTRMEDVADEAGLTRQAVYFHFPSRTSLLLALIPHVGQQMGIDALFGEARRRSDPRDALDASIRATARYQARIAPVALAIDLARHTDEAAAIAWGRQAAKVRSSIRQMVGPLARELRPGWSVRDVAEAIWALCSIRTFDDLVAGRRWRPEKVGEMVVTAAAGFFKPARPKPARRGKPRHS